MQFTETTLPTVERQRGARPFEMTPFMRFLEGRLDDLRPLLRHRLDLRVALHKHPGVPASWRPPRRSSARFRASRWLIFTSRQSGCRASTFRCCPRTSARCSCKELEAARAAGVDALAAVYHSDHRELCAHERDWPFRIVNVLEIVGESMGIRRDDRYKHLKMLQDADAIVADCGDLIARHGLDAEVARSVIVKGMLADQPLPLAGSGTAP